MKIFAWLNSEKYYVYFWRITSVVLFLAFLKAHYSDLDEMRAGFNLTMSLISLGLSDILEEIKKK